MSNFDITKKLLNDFEYLGIPAFDISVYYKGREVFREYRGVVDEKGTPLIGTERYNLYSCSKMITCVAGLILIQQGKMALDDEISKYLPAFERMTLKKSGEILIANNAIKIFHLFTMTAGLNYDMTNRAIEEGKRKTQGRCPTVEMMKYISRMPLCFEPGERWEYSLCHDVLAAIIEIISGKTFGDFVKENIFNPLGMKDTSFLLTSEEKLCEQYAYEEDKGIFKIDKEIRPFKFGSMYESGGAGAVGTVNDFMRFLEGVRTRKILSNEWIATMTTDWLTEKQRMSCWVEEGYGYGLGVRVPNKKGIRTDYGWGGAAGQYFAIDEKNEISLFYSQHVRNPPNFKLRECLIETVKLDLGKAAYIGDMWLQSQG